MDGEVPMTAQQPQREHCSCESRCIWYPSWDENLKKPCSMIHSCTSRPHTPAPDITIRRQSGTCCPEPTCDNRQVEHCEMCGQDCSKCLLTLNRQHDAAIAHTATLAENKRVLDEMRQWLESICWHNTKGYPFDHKAPRKRELLAKIESLRTAAQEDKR
jgi:hypothetical protein